MESAAAEPMRNPLTTRAGTPNWRAITATRVANCSGVADRLGPRIEASTLAKLLPPGRAGGPTLDDAAVAGDTGVERAFFDVATFFDGVFPDDFLFGGVFDVAPRVADGVVVVDVGVGDDDEVMFGPPERA